MNATTARPARKNRPVTQKQIAEQLQVSQSLVALALNGHPSISESTRLKVESAAREMGYDRHANSAARSLAAQRYGTAVRTGQIAVLMGDFLEGHPLQDMPFFQEILQGIHGEAASHSLDVAIHILRPGNLPRAVTSGNVDGAICVYSRTIAQDLAEQNVQIPLVHLSHYDSHSSAIYPDDRQGTFETTSHLLQLGHRDIAYMGGFNNPRGLQLQERRAQGFRDAFAAHGLTLDENMLFGDMVMPSVRAGAMAFNILQGRGCHFTAVVCAHDIVALGVWEEATKQGLRVPKDLSITGFDGTPAQGYGGSQILTTAYFDRVNMGRKAVEWVNTLADNPILPPQHFQLPVQLLVRQTTATPAGL